MKRLLALVLAAVSLTAVAAWERVGVVHVADATVVGEAVGQLGACVGNPLAAAGMAAAVADLPTLKYFGPMRPGSTMALSFYADAQALAERPGDALGSLERAVLYPIAVAKAEFLRRHGGAAETNGVVAVDGGELWPGATAYVAFSPDSKWVGASEKAEWAKRALDEIPLAGKAMEGDVVRLGIDEKGFASLGAAVRASDSIDDAQRAVLESLRSLVCGLRVTERGIDLRGAVRFAAGSEAARCGLKPLGARPLAFVGKTSVAASAQAEDCGNDAQAADRAWDDIVAVVRKNGLDLARFYARKKTPYGSAATVDLGEAIKLFGGRGGGKAFADLDAGRLLRDVAAIKSLKADRPFAAKASAYAESLGVKGFESAWTVEERFAATLPEAAGKQPFAVGFFSLSSVLKTLLAHADALIPEELRPLLKPALDQLAAETKRGCAQMRWTQDGEQRFFVRISADEMRCVGGLAGLSSAMMLLGTESSFQCGGDDGDDED